MFGAPGYAPVARPQPLVRLGEALGADARTDEVPEEVPVAFIYGGRSHVVVMATPADLEDLAIGFSLTEQIVASPGEISRIDVVRHARGIELQMQVPAAVAERLADRSRSIASRTGCGLCGVEAIDEALRQPPPVTSTLVVGQDALWRAAAALNASQPLNDRTRAVHGAAWAEPDGTLRVVREDVGRHNALDKVLGTLARAGMDASAGFVVVTSRASYEMVLKAAMRGVPVVAAVSRPTALAVRIADALGVGLVGLLRGRGANVYAHPDRFTGSSDGT